MCHWLCQCSSCRRLAGGITPRHLYQSNVEAGYVQASDREDTGKASGTRYSPQIQEPRANARRLMKSRHAAGADPVSLRNQPPRVSVRLSRLSASRLPIESFGTSCVPLALPVLFLPKACRWHYSETPLPKQRSTQATYKPPIVKTLAKPVAQPTGAGTAHERVAADRSATLVTDTDRTRWPTAKWCGRYCRHCYPKRSGLQARAEDLRVHNLAHILLGCSFVCLMRMQAPRFCTVDVPVRRPTASGEGLYDRPGTPQPAPLQTIAS